MGATTFCWSQHVVTRCSPPPPPPLSHALASDFPPPPSSSSKRRGHRFVQQSNRSALFGTKLSRSRSCEIAKSKSHQTLRRACSASLDSFSHEEFAKSLQELALRFHISGEEEEEEDNTGDAEFDILSEFRGSESDSGEDFAKIKGIFDFSGFRNSRPFKTSEPPWVAIRPDPPNWSESVERKANSVYLPLSLRMLKRKKQWEEGFREAGDSAYCSVKKAFSSMVFIIRELQSYTLHMREILFYQDLQGVLVRVQKEMNASFVWLFQQIFSRTPMLMVYVMILLANFTVCSMSNSTTIAAAPPPGYYRAATETVAGAENRKQPKFDPLSMKTFSISGWTASVGGSGGGGGKLRHAAGATDGGDGRFEESLNGRSTIYPDEVLRVSSGGNRNQVVKEEEGVWESEEETEVKQWNSMVEEATRMQEGLREVALDQETMQRFVSPVRVEMEGEDNTEYFRTELLYQHAVSEEPNNPLILSNYAQFLYLVVHDHDRAEEYFKRAVCVEPPDADSLSRYASFLWLGRKDIDAAEEAFLEAIAADPSNTFHAANYAHFLWNTGGEDTCYPLDGSA